ncbi:S-adenosyl-L-methionine-dependent methyltransferase [Sporodiniella umbellata]|nr:S-adenosyl-L-methionine-dependent methyltransferase [Sporodiniella umbellata]
MSIPSKTNFTTKDCCFDSYDHLGIHEEMLKDTVRTISYRNAMVLNKHLFKDKTVLDVGCGIGIISMFAAKSGAKHVYGIDRSNIIQDARTVIKDNKLEDKITLIQGKMEEIALPVDKVDIIVSEWMGHFLLYESMLEAVIFARDKYLAPGGLIFPDKATMYITAIEGGEYRDDKIDFWDDIYGFDYSHIKQRAMREPVVETVKYRSLMSSVYRFQEIDVAKIRKEELAFKVPFEITAAREEYVHAFACWFDIEFNHGDKPIGFSTGPHAKYTHWKQTVFCIPEILEMKSGENIKGTISCAPNGIDSRNLDINIDFQLEGEHRSTKESLQLHASVLQFLVDHGYVETLDAFKKEAKAVLDNAEEEYSSSSDELARQLSQLQIQRNNELAEGDGEYFTTLICEYPDIHYANILAVAVDPQSRLLATSAIDKTVKLSNYMNPTLIPRTYRHHQAPVLSIEFHPKHPQFLLTTSMDGSSVIADSSFEPEFGQDLEVAGVHQVFKDHKKYVVRGLFSPDGDYMATASYDRTVCIYKNQSKEMPKYELVKQVGPFLGNVESICYGKDQLILGVRNDNYLHYIHLPSLSIERVNMNSTGDDWVSFSPVHLSVSPDGKHLLCTTDHASGRTILFAIGESRQLQNYYVNASDNQFVTRLHAWHPSGLYFYATGNDDHSISIIEAKTGSVVHQLQGHKAMVRSLVISPDIGLISTGYDQSVKIWSWEHTASR